MKDKGYEKGESQPFWLSLLRDVYGVEHPEQFIQFEEQVHLDHTSFIDGTIPATHVLIEQKGLGKDLNKPIKQSDGALLTPFEQAKRYILELPVSQHPRWVVTCNFSTFYVYDMERPRGEPEIIELANLEKDANCKCKLDTCTVELSESERRSGWKPLASVLGDAAAAFGCVNRVEELVKQFLRGAVAKLLARPSVQFISCSQDILSRESLNGHALRNKGSKQPVVAFVLGTFP